MNRRALWLVAPALAMMLWTIAPLATGQRTLILRDVTTTHLELRAELGRAIREARLPLVDGARAGGQGLLGNPNAVPLYPDNLLLLVASDLWQLNAHFWLHWLLALPAMYGLGRTWGLGREASWVAAVFYAFSGYFVSQMNLYNAVAGVALAPALAAALLASARPEHRRWALSACGGLWALQLVAGDPILAVLALASALALAMPERRRLPWGGLALALAAGTLVAAPQWIEMLRLLPGSYRGFWGTQVAGQGRGSPSPSAALELLLPLFYGRPDLSQFWGNRHFGGTPALYFSLAPGLLVLAGAFVGADRRTPRGRWALGALAASALVVFSGGAAGALLARLPGGELFRYAVKFALVGMLVACLVAARGFERARSDERARRAFVATLAVLLGLLVSLGLFFLAADGALAAGFRALFARGLDDAGFAAQRAGWMAMAFLQALVAVAALALVGGAKGRRWAAAALVALHAGSQLLVLRALLPTDETAPYRGAPEILAAIPPTSVTAHGSVLGTFGGGYFEEGASPDARAFWRIRRAYDELYSFALHAAGRRSELHVSSEGLDAFPVVATAMAMKGLDDVRRLRVLAATGVDRLVIARSLAPEVGDAARLLAVGSGAPPIRVYEVAGAIGDATLVGSWRYAPHMNAAIETVVSRGFDPARETVLAGSAPPREGPNGRAEIRRFAADEIDLAVDSPAGGVVVVRRAWHSVWRVEVDGRAAPMRIANLTRLAVEVPPGPHRVRFFVSRRPFAFALALTAVGLATLVALARRRPAAAAAERAT